MTALTLALRKKLQPDESAEQRAVIAWAASLEPRHPELALLYAIPNAGGYKGGYRSNVALVVQSKRMGVRSGVPDLHLPVARSGYHGLWLELKRQLGGKVSPEQTWWLEALRKQGHYAEVCRGAAEAITILTDYLTR